MADSDTTSKPPFDIRPGESYTDKQTGKTWELTDHGQWIDVTGNQPACQQTTRDCATCCHLIVPSDARGRRVVRPDKSYRCGYVVNWPPLPQSITGAHDWRVPDPKSRGVWKGYGAECPTWENLNGQ